jgi:hypothetical protein
VFLGIIQINNFEESLAKQKMPELTIHIPCKKRTLPLGVAEVSHFTEQRRRRGQMFGATTTLFKRAA